MIGKLTGEEIESVLNENVLGRIGCNDGKRTYVVPVNYVYDGKSIVAHSAEGLKIKIMRANPEVCFEVDDMKSFIDWKSVIAWGIYQEITSEWDRYHALQLFAERMMYMKVSGTAAISDLQETSYGFRQFHPAREIVYRIILQDKTGRFESP